MKSGPPRLLFTPAELAALGRCTGCGWHPLQGHHNNCPNEHSEAPT